MKKLIVTCFLLAIVALGFAQIKKQTRLLQKGEFVIHGFGETAFGVNQARDLLMLDGSFAAAAVLNQTYMVGFFIEGNMNNLAYPVTYQVEYGVDGDFFTTVDDGNFNFLLSGFQVGYLYQSNFPFHAGATMRCGWGESKLYDPFGREIMSAAVTAIEPRLEGFYRFNTWFKMKISLGYRLVTRFDGGNAFDLNGSTFQSPTAQLGFQFGWFDLK